MTNTKDRMFLFAVVVVSIVAGMMLMQAINNYKNQEEVDAATSTLIRPQSANNKK